MVSLVTVLPYASCTATRGCAAKATPAADDADGCRVNASREASAGVMVMLADVPARVVGLSVAVTVVASAATGVTGTVATPASNVTLLPAPQPPGAG